MNCQPSSSSLSSATTTSSQSQPPQQPSSQPHPEAFAEPSLLEFVECFASKLTSLLNSDSPKNRKKKKRKHHEQHHAEQHETQRQWRSGSEFGLLAKLQPQSHGSLYSQPHHHHQENHQGHHHHHHQESNSHSNARSFVTVGEILAAPPQHSHAVTRANPHKHTHAHTHSHTVASGARGGAGAARVSTLNSSKKSRALQHRELTALFDAKWLHLHCCRDRWSPPPPLATHSHHSKKFARGHIHTHTNPHTHTDHRQHRHRLSFIRLRDRNLPSSFFVEPNANQPTHGKHCKNGSANESTDTIPPQTQTGLPVEQPQLQLGFEYPVFASLTTSLLSDEHKRQYCPQNDSLLLIPDSSMCPAYPSSAACLQPPVHLLPPLSDPTFLTYYYSEMQHPTDYVLVRDPSQLPSSESSSSSAAATGAVGGGEAAAAEVPAITSELEPLLLPLKNPPHQYTINLNTATNQLDFQTQTTTPVLTSLPLTLPCGLQISTTATKTTNLNSSHSLQAEALRGDDGQPCCSEYQNEMPHEKESVWMEWGSVYHPYLACSTSPPPPPVLPHMLSSLPTPLHHSLEFDMDTRNLLPDDEHNCNNDSLNSSMPLHSRDRINDFGSLFDCNSQEMSFIEKLPNFQTAFSIL